jgi:hypothetical protein
MMRVWEDVSRFLLGWMIILFEDECLEMVLGIFFREIGLVVFMSWFCEPMVGPVVLRVGS